MPRFVAVVPDGDEGLASGTPSLHAGGRFPRQPENGKTFTACRDLDVPPFLIDARPGVVFVTVSDYSTVLAPLPRAERGVVCELFEGAWLGRTPKRLGEAFLSERGAHPEA